MKFLRLQQLNSKSTAGFSLIELSITIALLILLLMLSGAHIRFLDRIVLDTELEKLATICTYLQRSARAHHKPEQLIFDLQQNQYRYHRTTHTLTAGIQFGYPSYIKGPPGNPTDIVQTPVTFAHHTITFYPTGIIDAGTVYLTDKAKQRVVALSCAVAQVSYLRKYRYTDRWISI